MICAKDKQALERFLKTRIPAAYKELDATRGESAISPDLMYCYEELFDYVHDLLKGMAVDPCLNFVGVRATALTDEYSNTLDSIKESTEELKEFCNMLLNTIETLKRHTC